MTAQGRIAILIAVLASLIIFTVDSKNTKYIDISHIKVLEEKTQPIIVDASDFLIPLDEEEFNCMRLNMYYEVRNQKSDEAYAAVGYTVMNRVAQKNSSICGIVKKKGRSKTTGKIVCQFSWYCDGKSDVPKLMVRTKTGKMVPNLSEQEAWNRAGRLAEAVMRNEVDNPIGRATMYHATYVSPKWDFKKLNKVARIETHIFYETKV